MQDRDKDKGDDLYPERLPLTLILHELNGEARYSRHNRMRPRLSLRSQLAQTNYWTVSGDVTNLMSDAVREKKKHCFATLLK